ncbi:hypothetical protein ENSA5_62660 [Enhygromyxa salina]|uniref:Uncharacterized protein n=1 Tax=Enhygromyxa salina TaxID=215803 RepID=A0A2S9XCR3_9BACT|nr:hypothetical protein ENSA5_62660 [Enhygromyxa salina]
MGVAHCVGVGPTFARDLVRFIECRVGRAGVCRGACDCDCDCLGVGLGFGLGLGRWRWFGLGLGLLPGFGPALGSSDLCDQRVRRRQGRGACLRCDRLLIEVLAQDRACGLARCRLWRWGLRVVLADRRDNREWAGRRGLGPPLASRQRRHRRRGSRCAGLGSGGGRRPELGHVEEIVEATVEATVVARQRIARRHAVQGQGLGTVVRKRRERRGDALPLVRRGALVVALGPGGRAVLVALRHEVATIVPVAGARVGSTAGLELGRVGGCVCT